MQIQGWEETSHFHTTQWTMVLSAGGPTTDLSTNALSRLCQRYYYPVYAFIRSRGNNPSDSEDLTQAFFEKLLEKSILAHADPNRGKFRCFLMTSIKNFLHSEYERRSALKRGGDVTALSFDYDSAEQRFTGAVVSYDDPEKLFHREWSRTLIESVTATVRMCYDGPEKKKLFDALQEHLWCDSEAIPYPMLADQLGISLSSIKVTVFECGPSFVRF